MAEQITNVTNTKAAALSLSTPFQVSFTDGATNAELEGSSLVWIAEDFASAGSGKPSLDISWDDNTELPLPLDAKLTPEEQEKMLTRKFTINGGGGDVKYNVRAYTKKSGKPDLAGPGLVIVSKDIDLSFDKIPALIGSGDSVIAGGRIDEAAQVLTLTTIVKGKDGNPVDSIQVDFDFGDDLDIESTGTTFYSKAKSPFTPNPFDKIIYPTALTDNTGEATVLVTCKTPHALTFSSRVIGFKAVSNHTCVFADLDDSDASKPAPNILLNDGVYDIPKGTYTFEATLRPGDLAATDKVFLVVNREFVPPVLVGSEFNGNIDIPLSYLVQKEEFGSNLAGYYVQNESGTVSGSSILPFGVTGSYENTPDFSITDRPMATPTLIPALPTGKTISSDYMLSGVPAEKPGITVVIPALAADSPYIGSGITVRFYLNGYVKNTYNTLSKLVLDTTLKGKAQNQKCLLPISTAQGYGVNRDGKKDLFYCEYLYKTNSGQEVYSGYIQYPINTTRP